MNKSEKIFLLSNIVIVGFFIAIIFHYFCANILHLEDPFNTFLLYPKWFIADIKNITDASLYLKPFSMPDSMVNYFPLIYFFLFPFALLKNYLIEYTVFLLVFLCFFSFQNYKNFSCKDFSKLQNFQNVFILTFMTYPFLYLLERGNIDMLLMILFTLSIYAFYSKNYLKSSVLLAIINAIKPFCLPFLILFVYEKRWKELFINIFLTTFLVVGGFLLLQDNIFSQFAGLKTNLLLYKQQFLYHPFNGTSTCSSLFQALKLIYYNAGLTATDFLVKIYGFIIFFGTLITVYFAWKETVFWKRIALLTLYMSVFPYIIFDYKLIFLFIPLWFFVNSEEKSRFDLIYTILFGLLLIPKKQLIFFPITDFSTIVNPIILLCFMGLIIYEQLKKEKE